MENMHAHYRSREYYPDVLRDRKVRSLHCTCGKVQWIILTLQVGEYPATLKTNCDLQCCMCLWWQISKQAWFISKLELPEKCKKCHQPSSQMSWTKLQWILDTTRFLSPCRCGESGNCPAQPVFVQIQKWHTNLTRVPGKTGNHRRHIWDEQNCTNLKNWQQCQFSRENTTWTWPHQTHSSFDKQGSG